MKNILFNNILFKRIWNRINSSIRVFSIMEGGIPVSKAHD